MKLKELKDWIDTLPEEFLEFSVVNAEMGEVGDGELTYRLDMPVVAVSVDEESKEILILNEDLTPKEK